MRILVKNLVASCLALTLGNTAHATCDRLPVEGLAEHTDYRGDVCTLELRFYDYWINHRAEVAAINTLIAKMNQTSGSYARTDVFMDINKLTIQLRGKLTQEAHGLFGKPGRLDVKFLSEPRDQNLDGIHGYNLDFSLDWTEGTWPLTDHKGSVTVNLRLNEDKGRVVICVGSECRAFDDNGQAGELLDTSPR